MLHGLLAPIGVAPIAVGEGGENSVVVVARGPSRGVELGLDGLRCVPGGPDSLRDARSRAARLSNETLADRRPRAYLLLFSAHPTTPRTPSPLARPFFSLSPMPQKGSNVLHKTTVSLVLLHKKTPEFYT